MKENRQQIEGFRIEDATADVVRKLKFRLEQKGSGTFASRHELLGIMEEECYELTKAVHEEKRDLEGVRRELLDIAVTAVFGIACIDSGGLEW